MRTRLLWSALLVLTFAAGCGSSQTPPPQGGGAVVNSGVPAFHPAITPHTKFFYVVGDGSSSMEDPMAHPGPGDQTRMGALKWAVTKMVPLIPEDAAIALYVFDGNGYREVLSLDTGQHEALSRQVQAIYPNANTPLAEAMYHGLKQLVKMKERQHTLGEYRLIVLTDGEDTGGGMEIPEVIKYANDNGIPIYTVGIEVQPGHSLERETIYARAENAAALETALAETVAEFDDVDLDKLVQ